MAMHHHAGHHHAGCGGPMLSRRAALLGLGATISFSAMRPAHATVSIPQKLIILNVKGGLDGLSTVVPYGDGNLAGLRSALIPPAVGQPGGMFDLGGFFGLNPAMPKLYNMFQAGQMTALHAVGGITATRSHFSDQANLQCGSPILISTGWLNRLSSLLPYSAGGVENAVSLGVNGTPISEGPQATAGWAADPWTPTSSTLAGLVQSCVAGDALIGPATIGGFADRNTFNTELKGTSGTGLTPMANLGRVAGTIMSAAGGPALAIIQSNSVDTHNDQVNRLQTSLSDIDNTIYQIQKAMGTTWSQTVIMTITEFGRTAYENGTTGTDHGTAFAVLLAGGAVAGGQVIATWPGLGPSQLYEGRDLAPTLDIRSIALGLIEDHLSVPASDALTIFPSSDGISPLSGLTTD